MPVTIALLPAELQDLDDMRGKIPRGKYIAGFLRLGQPDKKTPREGEV
jgi:hypothetical protein